MRSPVGHSQLPLTTLAAVAVRRVIFPVAAVGAGPSCVSSSVINVVPSTRVDQMIYLPPHRAVHHPLPNRSRHARRRQARDNSATVADRVVRGLTCHSLRLRLRHQLVWTFRFLCLKPHQARNRKLPDRRSSSSWLESHAAARSRRRPGDVS
jgi:hypothetical protein